MKSLITFFTIFVISQAANAQRADIPLPRDARDVPVQFGLGQPYASSAVVNVTTYGETVRYEVPNDGDDHNRAFRHLMVLNRSTTRTVYVCFGNVDGCSGDGMIVRPEYGLIFEPLLFGRATGKSHIYFRVDAAGSANIDFSVW